jgi:hypothetical protein
MKTSAAAIGAAAAAGRSCLWDTSFRQGTFLVADPCPVRTDVLATGLERAPAAAVVRKTWLSDMTAGSEAR